MIGPKKVISRIIIALSILFLSVAFFSVNTRAEAETKYVTTAENIYLSEDLVASWDITEDMLSYNYFNIYYYAAGAPSNPFNYRCIKCIEIPKDGIGGSKYSIDLYDDIEKAAVSYSNWLNTYPYVAIAVELSNDPGGFASSWSSIYNRDVPLSNYTKVHSDTSDKIFAPDMNSGLSYNTLVFKWSTSWTDYRASHIVAKYKITFEDGEEYEGETSPIEKPYTPQYRYSSTTKVSLHDYFIELFNNNGWDSKQAIDLSIQIKLVNPESGKESNYSRLLRTSNPIVIDYEKFDTPANVYLSNEFVASFDLSKNNSNGYYELNFNIYDRTQDMKSVYGSSTVLVLSLDDYPDRRVSIDLSKDILSALRTKCSGIDPDDAYINFRVRAGQPNDGGSVSEYSEYSNTVKYTGLDKAELLDTLNTDSCSKIAYQSLLLDGSIGVNFYLDLPNELVSYEDAFVLINDSKYMLAKAEKKTSGYLFTYYINAKEINDDIAVSLYFDKDNRLNLKNESAVDGVCHCSVKSYLEIEKKSSDPKMAKLATAMESYCSWAQKYFNYNMTNYVAAAVPNSVDLSNYAHNYNGTLPDGLTYYGSSLILKSETTIRHYFVVANERKVSEYTFKVNGAPINPASKGNLIYIDISNIPASCLGILNKLSVSDGNETFVLNYSALSYMNKMKIKYGEDNDLVRTGNAMGLYFTTAKDYFEKLDNNESEIDHDL